MKTIRCLILVCSMLMLAGCRSQPPAPLPPIPRPLSRARAANLPETAPAQILRLPDHWQISWNADSGPVALSVADTVLDWQPVVGWNHGIGPIVIWDYDINARQKFYLLKTQP